MDTETGAPVQQWRFESKRIKPRTGRLIGAMLLGKVPTKFNVEIITEHLGKVYVPNSEEETVRVSSYSCRDWVLEALQVLNNEGVIQLPGSPINMLETGQAFVEIITNGRGPVHEEPLFICDTSGNQIASEIPAFTI